MDDDSASDWDSMSEAVQPSAGEILEKSTTLVHIFFYSVGAGQETAGPS